ncbi:Ubiquitin carboxyl-terminal hydrolase-like protein 12 [Elsinoe fawcettii]|nr:Ubiquitin carboxyl-terminal hydrolase-like protein 12 [Elsinoe fawcettii]
MPIGLQHLKHLRTNSITTKSEIPAGLGNWDNSCYQNSILQGLSSLSTFAGFLNESMCLLGEDANSTTGSLHALTQDLTNWTNNGKRIWTPAKLKSMSSWQQQDAQEYYSRVLDDVEKDLKKVLGVKKETGGLETIKEIQAGSTKQVDLHEHVMENPLEGLLGQRVGCVSCGFSEGITLLPFNCLTVSLGTGPRFSLENLLDEYTNLENIDGVECLSCTFRRQEKRLQTLLTPKNASSDVPDQSNSIVALPEAVQKQISERLSAVQESIADGDFSDQALKRCTITKDAKVSSTKTKQVVLARPPRSLAVHVNRSIFDEMTGSLRKNMAFVEYPKYLSLKPWTLGQNRISKHESVESWPSGAGQSLVTQHRGLPPKVTRDYVLRSVVTHYGRHENGHYVCYRQHRADPKEDIEEEEHSKKSEQWWRLSDDDVSRATEEEVLNQGGVFMLFYERLPSDEVDSGDAGTERPAEASTSADTQSQESTVVGTPEDAASETLKEPQREQAASIVHDTTQKVDLHDETPTLISDTAQRLADAGKKGLEQKQQPSTPPPQMLRTSRAKSRKGSPLMSPGLPAVAAQ